MFPQINLQNNKATNTRRIPHKNVNLSSLKEGTEDEADGEEVTANSMLL